MKQLALICLVFFVLPLLMGGALRFALRKRTKAWLMTAAAALLSLAAWAVVRNPPVLGSELYWFRFFQAVSFTAGSLLIGLLVRWRRAGGPEK